MNKEQITNKLLTIIPDDTTPEQMLKYMCDGLPLATMEMFYEHIMSEFEVEDSVEEDNYREDSNG